MSFGREWVEGLKKSGGLGHMFRPLYFEYIYQFNVLVGILVGGDTPARKHPQQIILTILKMDGIGTS